MAIKVVPVIAVVALAGGAPLPISAAGEPAVHVRLVDDGIASGLSHVELGVVGVAVSLILAEDLLGDVDIVVVVVVEILHALVSSIEEELSGDERRLLAVDIIGSEGLAERHHRVRYALGGKTRILGGVQRGQL